MKVLRRWVLHPFLLAAAPVTALLAQNISEVDATVGVRSILVALVLAGVLLNILRFLLGDWLRAAAVCSLILLLFFNYGHVYVYLKDKTVLGFLVGRHRLLLPVWAALFVSGVWGMLRSGDQRYTITSVLNVVGLVTFILPLTQIISFEVRTQRNQTAQAASTNPAPVLKIPKGQNPPDIYYIILDAYGRSDVLQTVYQFNNDLFLDQLTEMGFFVAQCSQSNYAQTELSLASSLNFNYLEALGDQFVTQSADRSPLWPLIWDSDVRRMLRAGGYTDVAFETGYQWTEIENADFFLTASTSSLDILQGAGNVNRFEVMLLDSTVILFLRDASIVLPEWLQADLDYPYREHRDRITSQFNALSAMPRSVDSPKFVFAHLVTPHSPFVFGPEGQPVETYELEGFEARTAAYRDQLQYVNTAMLEVLQQIIASSDTPPIIILQSDHGPEDVGGRERLAILNAYFLPGVDTGALHDSITPVNTFRVIFNAYFEAQLPLLEDTSYFSIYQQPYDYQQFSTQAGSCEP